MKKLILFLMMNSFMCEAYQFGDIIAFPRKKICGCGPTLYSHYAIYVGNETIPGKEPGQDIFHRTRASCKFGKLSEESKASNGQTHKENYLDDTERPFIKHNAILQRIKKMMKEKFCKLYSLFTNNCEHLATFVRYGKEISKQHGTIAGRLWNLIRGKRNVVLTPDYTGFPCRVLCSITGK
ncbi:phospholipase A and acyltransferase 1-like [Anabas testudineus]|uniref:phospholipase A and acyltransferase 1-like n=1 Tax=Anabas testudineus TaxID=64144 RepID=UPI000E461D5D|nr:phospholipase A and acyltransferase 1-like [Anabas testudineus]